MTNFGEPYINSFTFKRIGSLPPNPPPLLRLSWKVSRAISVVIDQGIGTVNPGEGFVDVLITHPQVSYTLTATNAAGATTRTLFSQVAPPPPSLPRSVTSTTFPVTLQDVIGTDQDVDSAQLLFPLEPIDQVTTGQAITVGQLRDVAQTFLAEPDRVNSFQSVVSGQLRDVAQSYPNWPAEGFSIATDITGGSLAAP